MLNRALRKTRPQAPPKGTHSERLAAIFDECSWPRAYYDTTVQLCRLVDPTLVIEVGVAFGYHARHLLSHLPSIHYVGVDPYPGAYDPHDKFPAEVSRIFELPASQAMDTLFHTVTSDLTKEFGERFVLLRSDSRMASREFVDESVDVVFIDGDHRYDAVLSDLTLWWPKLRCGGLMIGDDYSWPQVQAAVTHFADQMHLNAMSVEQTDSRHKIYMLIKD